MGHKTLFFSTTIMTNQAHRYALRALSAANLAPALADEIQSLNLLEIEKARHRAIQAGKKLIAKHLVILPGFLEVELNDDELTLLVSELLD
jgi:hypothetical protein